MQGLGQNKMEVIADFSDSDYSSDSSDEIYPSHRIGSGLGVIEVKPNSLLSKIQFTA
jgi:hypothetical protein